MSEIIPADAATTDETYRQEQIGRLPLWAQREIARLERDLNAAHARLSVGLDGARIVSVGYGAPNQAVPNRPLRFYVHPGYLETRLLPNGNGVLEVRSSARLALRPQASNVVTVSLEPL
jgi:hypothetical protein